MSCNYGDLCGKYTLQPGSILYKASDDLEYTPRANYCCDTGKYGVYFSVYNPFLSEAMTIENNKDIVINMYEVTQPITLFRGKYSFRVVCCGVGYADYNAPEIKNCNINISHIDPDIGSLSVRYPEYITDCAEVFLIENDLQKITYVNNYKFTLSDAKNKYYEYLL